MSSISGNIPNSNLNNLQNTQGTQTTQSTQTTGQGAIGQTGQVPEATKGNLNSVMGYAVMMESIMAIMPQMSNEDQDVLLASISAKLKDAQSKNDSDKIKGDEKVKSAMIQEQKSKFDESAKKIQKAIDDDKAAGPFKWLKAIFEAIASVVMMIVGAVLIATGVGAAVGALMITAGVIGLVMAVDSMVQLGTGHGIMGNIVKACGGSEDQISKADMGFGIALGILGIGVAIVMLCIPGGQAMAAEEFADAGAMLAEEAVNTAEVVETATNTAAQIAQTVGNVTNVAAQVVDGVSTGITAGFEYDAAMNQASALEDKADAKKMGALAAQLDDFIDMALQHMMSVHAGFENMMDNLMEAVQDKGQTMQHAKLSG